jgi:heat shock protein HslJ
MRWDRFGYGAAALALMTALALPAAAKGKQAPPDQQTNPATPKTEEKKTEEKNFPTGSNWNLTEINGKPVPSDGPSLKVDGNYRGTGFSGCNTYSATLFPVRGMRLAMGPIALTRKTCEKEAMTTERLFLTILHSGPTWDIVGADLIVKSQAGTLQFRRGL